MIDLITSKHILYTEQEIIDNFPKEDFYVVFGTSHSAGWCDNGSERIMSREENWPAQLEKMLNKPVFNLAMGGVTPQLMLEIVCDFLYYYSKQNAKCLGAIIEPRAQDYTVLKDISIDFVKQTYNNKNLDKYIDMMQHHAIALGRDYYTKENISNYYNVFQLGRQINSARFYKYADLEQHTIDWIMKCVENQFMGGLTHFNCLNILLRMTQVLHSHNIPNHTFYWEAGSPNIDVGDKKMTNAMEKLYFDTMLAYIDRGINYIKLDNKDYINRFSFHIIKTVKMKKGNAFLADNICKCLHYNDKVSQVVAEIIYEKINEQ